MTTKDEVWIIKLARRSDDCPYKEKDTKECVHTGNTTKMCSKEHCKIKAIFK